MVVGDKCVSLKDRHQQNHCMNRKNMLRCEAGIVVAFFSWSWLGYQARPTDFSSRRTTDLFNTEVHRTHLVNLSFMAVSRCSSICAKARFLDHKFHCSWLQTCWCYWRSSRAAEQTYISEAIFRINVAVDTDLYHNGKKDVLIFLRTSMWCCGVKSFSEFYIRCYLGGISDEKSASRAKYKSSSAQDRSL